MYCFESRMYKFEDAKMAVATVLHFCNPTTGSREQYAVLESLVPRNLKNLLLKPKVKLGSREEESFFAVGPGCKLTKPFLKKGSNNITDITKTVLIQRVVRDPDTGDVFNQYQIASLNVIDPDLSKQLAKSQIHEQKWNKVIQADIQRMADPNTPTELLPVVYDFVWLNDQPQSAESWENGRPRRACTKPEPKVDEVELALIEASPSLPLKKVYKSRKSRKKPRAQDTEGEVQPTISGDTPKGKGKSTPSEPELTSPNSLAPNIDVAAIVNNAVTSALKANAAATHAGNNQLAHVLEKISAEMISLRTEMKSKSQTGNINTNTSTNSQQSNPRKPQPANPVVEEPDENGGGDNSNLQIQPFQQLTLSQTNKPPFQSPAATRQQSSFMNYHFIQSDALTRNIT
eukprot:g56084.t1